MDPRSLPLFAGALVMVSYVLSSFALNLEAELNPLYPKAITDLKEDIIKGLGFHVDDVKVTGFDARDALVGHSLSYEFEIEFDNKVIPLKLLEDVNRWEYVDLPIFKTEDTLKSGVEHGLIPKQTLGDGLPVLAPFQLVGPMELWIQDAKDMRLSLPNDVDAGILKKVMLAEGAAVTVKGARSVSLRHPLHLTLPLNRTHDGFASALVSLGQRLRHSTPLLSLRIVGPTSLTAVSYSNSNSSDGNGGLRIKRIAPGLVELSQKGKVMENEGVSVWPLGSVDGRVAKLIGLEGLLASVLGEKGKGEGWFRLGKVEVSAQRFVKMRFGLEMKKAVGGMRRKIWFEVVGRVAGERVVAEKIVRVRGAADVEDTIAPNVLIGNITSSPASHLLLFPPTLFTL